MYRNHNLIYCNEIDLLIAYLIFSKGILIMIIVYWKQIKIYISLLQQRGNTNNIFNDMLFFFSLNQWPRGNRVNITSFQPPSFVVKYQRKHRKIYLMDVTQRGIEYKIKRSLLWLPSIYNFSLKKVLIILVCLHTAWINNFF